ncbi:hypothetical protein [Nonomuraea sp. NPDC046570]|uniref:hypothetical protein n=1 Tax=Nonomuraea sp. NPDC046570 TaxID=3155255 RepID=UPI00340A7222
MVLGPAPDGGEHPQSGEPPAKPVLARLTSLQQCDRVSSGVIEHDRLAITLIAIPAMSPTVSEPRP